MLDEQEQNALEETAEKVPADSREIRPDMTPEATLALIAAGKPVAGVRITGLRLQGEFPKAIEFRDVILTRMTVDSATFKGRLGFFGCTMIRPKFGRSSVFEDGLSLQGSTIKSAIFEHIVVKKQFRLDNADTNGPLKVIDCKFEGRVRAWEGKFNGWANWIRCEFLEDVDFRSVNAAEGIVFEDCTFNGDVLIRGASVGKKLDFTNSRINAMLDLSKAKLHDFVYLETIAPGPNMRFAVRNAVTNRLLIFPAQLKGRLDSELKDDYVGAMHEYGLLKRNYEAQHRHDEEDWTFHQFKINQRRAKATTWSKPWQKLKVGAEWLFLDQGCGYGSNPWRAVRTAIIIVLLFAIIYACGVTSFKVENPPLSDVPITNFFNRTLYALATSVTVFTSGLSINALQITQGWMLLPLLIEALMGTFIWGLFIVSFSRKVIR